MPNSGALLLVTYAIATRDWTTIVPVHLGCWGTGGAGGGGGEGGGAGGRGVAMVKCFMWSKFVLRRKM